MGGWPLAMGIFVYWMPCGGRTSVGPKFGASVGGRLGRIRPLLLLGVEPRSGMCSGELCMAVGDPKGLPTDVSRPFKDPGAADENREWSEPWGESARSSEWCEG